MPKRRAAAPAKKKAGAHGTGLKLGRNLSAKKGGGEREFNGLADVFKKTLASDGIAGLYRGFVISAVGIFSEC